MTAYAPGDILIQREPTFQGDRPRRVMYRGLAGVGKAKVDLLDSPKGESREVALSTLESDYRRLRA